MATQRNTWADIYDWRIDRTVDASLFEQIARQIRDAVVSRHLKPRTKLPSTRALAHKLGVGRASVVAAYEHLLAEGVLDGKVGAGTFIAANLPVEIAAVTRRTPPSAPLAIRKSQTARQPEDAALGDERPFTGGRVILDARTIEIWRKLTQRMFRSFGPDHLGYTDPMGTPALREAICDYLRAARGVRCDADQILVTSGTQQAIDLTIRVLLKPGDTAWVENPCYPMTAQALRAVGVSLQPVPVDGQGMDVSEGIRLAANARVVFATPSHQYPTGAVLSMPRRLELLNWGSKTGAWIFEDDYASEYRYSGRPLTSLQGLDDHERVIYSGTLNKVLFPGLRLGYVVVPRALLKKFTATRYLVDRQPSSLYQPVVAAFLAEGHFLAHLRRMRLMYTKQRDILAEELTKKAGERVRIQLPDQGLHLLAYLRPGVSDTKLEELARGQGIVTRALSRLYLDGTKKSALMLGFTGYVPQVIRPAAMKLAKVIGQFG